ncbi:MAG: TIGR00282 family metallophosphoesterase [Magnetococcales bacterium]|nr:TIGR00282 family metallophosphoesterase [Magnetococcales bacterium]
MTILLVGDVVGKSGRRCLREHLPRLRAVFNLALVVVNGENASSGVGLTPATTDEIFAMGADVVTSGNHIWRHKEILPYLSQERRLLRPRNYPPGVPGFGFGVFRVGGARVGVLNLQGRVFMEAVDCPFRVADDLLREVHLARDVEALVVDFHAEASSEKMAMGWHLDGRVSAVLGTHTHVPTADHRILPRGTGYQTDVGMSGCYESVIGMKVETALPRFLTQLPTRFEPAGGPGTLAGTVVRVDPATGRCREIIPVRVGGVLAPTPSP